MTAQVDYVLYHQLQENLDIRQGALWPAQTSSWTTPSNRGWAWSSRGVGGVSLRLRGGVHSQASGSLRYVKPGTPEAEAYQGSTRRTRAAVGASLVTAFGLRLDLASAFAGGATAVSAGVALRL